MTFYRIQRAKDSRSDKMQPEKELREGERETEKKTEKDGNNIFFYQSQLGATVWNGFISIDSDRMSPLEEKRADNYEKEEICIPNEWPNEN